MRYYYWSHSAKPTKAATFHPLDPSELPRSVLIAAVRAGVESGTIKGEEIECLFCEGMGEVVHDIDCEQCVRDGGMAHAEPCPECRGSGGLRVVVIGSVSDGGEDRP